MEPLLLNNEAKYDNLGYSMIDPTVASKIDPYRSYTARQIAKEGFIQNNVGNKNDHKFVLAQIKRGTLKAIDAGRKDNKRKTLKVKGQNIIDYLLTH